jgi:ATP-dependent DNA ligase
MRDAKGTKEFDLKRAVFPCYASIKKDGVRLLREDFLYTRNHNPAIGLDHIKPRFIDGCQHELDGEGLVRGCEFDEASGLIRNHQKVPEAYYMVFDAPSQPGTLFERYTWLFQNLILSDDVQLIEHVICHNLDELMEFYYAAIEAGEEGIMYKAMESLYNDKKNYEWMRMVPIKSADCPVIRIEEGTGKFEDSMGKVVVLFNGKECKVGTGFNEKPWADMTPAERRKAIKDGKGEDEADYESRRRGYIWTHPLKTISRIGCFEYKELSKNGVMRQPRFKGWRWDKKEVD